MFPAGVSQSMQLPPTQDALRKHVQRANYQAFVWKNALEAMPNITGPNGHGWIASRDGHLEVDWMDQKPAPTDLLELVSCLCRTVCTTGRCSCSKAALSCTDACLCVNCESGQKDVEDLDSNGDDDADESDESHLDC